VKQQAEEVLKETRQFCDCSWVRSNKLMLMFTPVRKLAFCCAVVICFGPLSTQAQDSSPTIPPSNRQARILVIGETKGFEHDSVPNAMATIWRMGHESRLWEATLRTDTELLSKRLPKERNVKSLSYFDAVVFASTTGELSLTEDTKSDLLSFIREDGKGFVGVHAALDTNYKWPEYGEMIGGYFDQHPWGTFAAPIAVEDPNFPAIRHFPRAFTKRDEIYQPSSWSRDKVNVLLSLDASKLDLKNPRVHRTDRDFAVAWAKTYGKGRVFYSTLGHTVESWDDPDIQKMYFEAIKWTLGMTEGSTMSHPKPAVP
jgi:uncharacterized protein